MRAESERLYRPNRRFLAPLPLVYELGFMPYRGDELIEDVRVGNITADEISLRVEEIYRRFASGQVAAYSKLMMIAVNNTLPLLVHCTSGRDRTGFACAIILLALGVSREDVLEDYMLSNKYRRNLDFQVGDDASAEVMAALTQVKPEYLQASFDSIDAGWGSFENYLVQALGVSEKQRNQFQTAMLTDA